MSGLDLRHYVRAIPDHPKPGIVFRDATPLYADPHALAAACAALAEQVAPYAPEIVIGPEARGFTLGTALAVELGAGFVGARKPGKLPRATVGAEYDLEYGSDRLEIHADAIAPGTRVVIHDDLLATGGTARAVADIVRTIGAEVVAAVFVIELVALGGRRLLEPVPVSSLIDY